MNPPLLLHSPVVAHAAQSFSLSSHLSSLYCFLAAAASSATSCVDFPGGAWLQALNPSFHVCSALSDSEHFPAQSPPVLQQFALPSLFLPHVAQACPTSAGFPAAGVVVALVTRDEGSPSGPIWLVDSAAVGRAVDTAAALASGHSANPTERMASRIAEPLRRKGCLIGPSKASFFLRRAVYVAPPSPSVPGIPDYTLTHHASGLRHGLPHGEKSSTRSTRSPNLRARSPKSWRSTSPPSSTRLCMQLLTARYSDSSDSRVYPALMASYLAGVRPGFASSSRELAQHAADHHAAQPTQPPAPRLRRGLLAGVRLACRSQTHAGRADDVRRWR